MQKRGLPRTSRWLTVGSCLAIGGVFGWVCWMETKFAVGLLIGLVSIAVALYVACASDQSLERAPWWLFW